MISIATVVHRPEVPMLQLQARSLARHFAREDVAEVLVLVNDVGEDACVAAVEAIRSDYGALAERLRIVRPDEVFSGAARRGLSPLRRLRLAYARRPKSIKHRRFGGWRGNTGWTIQQALKLAVSRAATARYVLILDAKNHFIDSVSQADFVAEDGRARWRTIVVPPGQRRWVTDSFALFGLTPPPASAELPPSVTPFCAERTFLLEVLQALEARVGPVEGYFSAKPSRATEFMLILAYAAKTSGSWDGKFAPGLPRSATVFHKVDSERIAELLDQAEAGGVKLMSIHRLRAKTMTEAEVARVLGLWRSRGLIASETEGRRHFA